ncbi:MAG: hypothetical protein IKY10_01750 [Clostridia bacterium]|nr:hypothetical protein [Clostridia bacterium]
MNILYKSKVKKQILENIHSANDVISDINKCLIPANNILWCHKLELDVGGNDVNNYELLKKNIYIALGHFNTLNEIYHINKKLCQDYPKLEEFSQSFFIKRFKIIENSIKLNIQELNSLKEYKFNKDTRNMVKHLQIILTNLQNIITNINSEVLEEKSL